MRMAMQAVILTIAAVALATTADAQDRSAQDRNVSAGASPRIASETTGAGAVPLAPIGHRQPTISGLPDGVRNVESGRGRPAVDPLGPLPKICSGC